MRNITPWLAAFPIAAFIFIFGAYYSTAHQPDQVLPAAAAETVTIIERSVLVEKDERPVVLSFCADWCKECQRIKPQLDKLRAKGVEIREVDYDENRHTLVEQYDVRQLPTFVVLYEGQEVARETSIVGLVKVLALIMKIIL